MKRRTPSNNKETQIDHLGVGKEKIVPNSTLERLNFRENL